MNKAVLISIQPKWCELIASGKKTAEVRKTRPKIETPFKCYIYCTKNGVPNRWLDETKHGKVIGEFVCNKIYKTFQCNSGWISENACLSRNEFFDYLGIERGTHFGYHKWAFAWCISDLVIYDKPKELSEFSKYGFGHPVPLKRPPQSWCYVEVMK